MTAPHRLFVYGTLAPDQPNDHVLAGISGVWSRGTVRGRLREIGWGATMGYPAIRLDPHGEEVAGYLLESTDLPAHWPRLDSFEGADYCRTLTEVRTENGDLVEAYVYVARSVPQDNAP